MRIYRLFDQSSRFAWIGLIAIALLGAILPNAYAGKYNKVLSVGDAAPAWKELPGTDEKKHSLSDLAEKAVVVVAFTCNSCPYAVDYEDRLIALAKKHGGADGKCAVVAVGSNQFPADAFAEMQTKAKAKQFNFAYLHDENQALAKGFGASRTPEFFVLDQDRKLVYQGAFDDSPDGSKITQRYVEDALAATLDGKKPAVAETPPVGCLIRTAKERRPKSP